MEGLSTAGQGKGGAGAEEGTSLPAPKVRMGTRGEQKQRGGERSIMYQKKALKAVRTACRS